MTDDDVALLVAREAYARRIVALGGSADDRLTAAFAAVPRERYLGTGPWSVSNGRGYTSTASSDPRVLYDDILVGIATERHINNGQPSLHARCLAACAPAWGETAVQVGAGGGYYTAILAEMVGAAGAVVAWEIEPDLAEAARARLAPLTQVHVVAGNAVTQPLPPADIVYVSAGATHPAGSWLDALKPGGRLVFPMTSDEGPGFMLMVTRSGTAAWRADCLLPQVRFIPCRDARNAEASRALAAAMAARPPEQIRSLRRGTAPDATAWCVGNGWWLSTAAPPGTVSAGA